MSDWLLQAVDGDEEAIEGSEEATNVPAGESCGVMESPCSECGGVLESSSDD
jgi:hypothetical protein